MHILHLLYDPPITPTPSAVQVGQDAIQNITALTEAVRTLPSLAVLALVIIAVILYIVLVARKQVDDAVPLNKQIEQSTAQSTALIKQLDAEREERRLDRVDHKELVASLLQRDKEKDVAMTESLSALTAAWESNRARDVTFAAQMAMLTAGVTDIEPIKTLIESAEATLEAAKRIEDRFPSLTELKTAITAVTETLEYLKKKQSDSKPIPVVIPEPQSDHNGSKSA